MTLTMIEDTMLYRLRILLGSSYENETREGKNGEPNTVSRHIVSC